MRGGRREVVAVREFIEWKEGRKKKDRKKRERRAERRRRSEGEVLVKRSEEKKMVQPLVKITKVVKRKTKFKRHQSDRVVRVKVYIYIHICVCVCMCVCDCRDIQEMRGDQSSVSDRRFNIRFVVRSDTS